MFIEEDGVISNAPHKNSKYMIYFMHSCLTTKCGITAVQIWIKKGVQISYKKWILVRVLQGAFHKTYLFIRSP